MADRNNETCYAVLPSGKTFEGANDACQNNNAEMVYFNSNEEVDAFIQVVKSGYY